MAQTEARRLPRVLSLFDITMLSSASMGPAYSLAVTMGPMIAAAAGLAPLSLVALSLVMLCIASSFAQLSRALPNAGSSYSWIHAAFGRKVGVYAAWILLISNFFAAMATALPAGTYTLALLAPGLTDAPDALKYEAVLGALWIFGGAFLLHWGLRPTAFTTALLVLTELFVLGASMIAAMFAHAVPVASAAPLPAIAQSAGGFLTAMLLAIWMLDGWEVSAAVSEETRDADTTAGRGGAIGLMLTATLLVAAMCAYQRVGNVAGFTAHQADAMAYVAERLGGGAWRIAIEATVLISTSSTLWTTLLYLTNSVYAMGRDGVLPRALGVLDAKDCPTRALAALTVLVAAVTLLNGFWPSAAAASQFVLDGSSVFLGLLFFGSSAAALRLASALRADVGQIAASVAGIVGLLVVIVGALLQAEAAVRWVDLGLLLGGVPFTLLRAQRSA